MYYFGLSKDEFKLPSENVYLDWVISETDKRSFFQQFRGYGDIAIIVKGEITITKGFNTWKSMVKKNKHRMDEMGMVMLFAGVQKDDPTKISCHYEIY